VKVSFINVDGIEYVAQYDKENVFFSTKGEDTTRKMVVVEISYGEIKSARVMKSGVSENLKISPEIQFNKSAHDIVRHYAPIMQKVSFNAKVA
jgi:exopolysaccharide biosynthesis protein